MFTNANVFGQILRASCFPVGTAGIILKAPTLYGDQPVTITVTIVTVVTVVTI